MFKDRFGYWITFHVVCIKVHGSLNKPDQAGHDLVLP
jgi:hypothetical protein